MKLILQRQIFDRHQNHPSVIAIKDMIGNTAQKFDFSHITQEHISKTLSKVNANKATGYDNIPPPKKKKLVKMSHEDPSSMLSGAMNRSFDANCFPEDMKRAETDIPNTQKEG